MSQHKQRQGSVLERALRAATSARRDGDQSRVTFAPGVEGADTGRPGTCDDVPRVAMHCSTDIREIPEPAADALRAYLMNFSDPSLPELSRFALFGSFARGDHREGSDIDLAVIFSGEPPGDRERSRIERALIPPATAVMLRDRIFELVSPVAIWESELGDGSAAPAVAFNREVLRDGIEIRGWQVGPEPDGRQHHDAQGSATAARLSLPARNG